MMCPKPTGLPRRQSAQLPACGLGQQCREPYRRGFTLVELLVVIAAVGILVTLLLPALSGSRKRAYDTVCRSNLRQLGIALANYTADFKAYPVFCDALSGGSTLNCWPELLEPYSGATWDLNLVKGQTDDKGRLYLCPAYARTVPLYSFPIGGDWSGGHSLGAYAYNWHGVWGPRVLARFLGLGGVDDPSARGILPPTRDSEVLRPSLMIAITDAPLSAASDDSVYGWTDFSEGTGFYDYEFESGQVLSGEARGFDAPSRQNLLSAIRARHSGRWNVVFCDGHVQAHKTRELFDWRDDAVLSLRNKDNLPHRELQSDPP